MPLVSIALKQIIIMTILMLFGILSYKIKLIDESTNKKLSNFLLNLVLPLLIFLSFQTEPNDKLMKGLLISFLLAFISHFIAILSAGLLVPRKRGNDVTIERFSIIYSNCAFIGIPIINGMFGSEGVFYLTAYITAFNVLIWTHGVIMMVGKQDVKTMVKTLISPTIMAIIMGLLFFILQIHIPDILYQSFNYIGSMNTPLAMIIAGVTIAQTDLRKVFGKVKIYYVAFIKLLLLPIALLLIYNMFPIDTIVLSTTIMAVACPTGAAVTLFALRYDKDALYSSEIFAITTLFSMVTIPLVMIVVQLVA